MLTWFRSEPEPDDLRARPARRPLYALVLLGAGYFAARHGPGVPSTALFGTAALALLVGLLGRGGLCRVAVCIAVLAGSAGWFAARVNERPRHSVWWSIDHDPLAEAVVTRVSGMVATPARALATSVSEGGFKPARSRASVFELSLRSVDSDQGKVAASGRVRIHFDGPLEALPESIVRPGAMVSITGRLRPAGPPMNPGEPPRDLLAAQDGRVGTLIVPIGELIAASTSPVGLVDRVVAGWTGMRESIRARILRTLGEPGDAEASRSRGRALIRAMLLGERDPALAEVESAFKRVGLVHLVAISGFNLAVLVWITLLAIRLTGDRGWLEPSLGAAAVLVYMLVLPGEASIQRAGLTLLVFTLAESCGRRYDRVTLLGCVAIVLLVVRPMDLWSLGFQLSFGVVGALLWLGQRVHARLWGLQIRGLVPTPRQRMWWWSAGSWAAGAVKAQISATLLAWAVAAPLIALHTGVFSPLAPIASLVVLPITVLLLGLGYAAMLLGLLAPPAAEVAGAVLDRLGEWTVWIVARIDEWPGATVHLPRLSALWAALATGCIIYWLGWGWKRDIKAWGLTVAGAAWLGLLCTVGVRVPAGVALRVNTLACGDGECHLVRSGTEAMLINCGSSGVRPDADDLARAVRELGAWKVPTVLITEPRVQAWSELDGLVGPLGVRTVLVPRSLVDGSQLDPTGPAAQLIGRLRASSVNVRILEAGDRFSLGPAAVVSMVGEPGVAARELLPRVRVETAAGTRSALFAGSGRYAQLEALPGRERFADVLVAPGTLRSADRPAEAARALGASVIVHSGAASHARELLARLGPLDVQARVTARGAAWSEIGSDGKVRSGTSRP